MELTPRTGPDSGAEGEALASKRIRSKRNRLPALAMIVVLLVVGSFVVVNALGSATTFYRNVDEAAAQRETLGMTRFRLQGTVVAGSIVQTGDGVSFDVAYNGVEIPVDHVGDPPEMFKANEAVLLEGNFDQSGSGRFDSNLMIVKHSEVYKEKEADRLQQADVGGKVPAATSVPGTTP
jgi:cytochrome c-type biogenesis protein CcmE